MKRIIALLATLLIALLVGCQIGKDVKPTEMNPNDLPDERAFQDEFTREFLQSVEETRPGYYPFLSKTGRYKMDFPASGVISKNFYSLKNNSYESLGFAMINKDQTGNHVTLIYYGEHTMDEIDFHLDFFQGRIGEVTEFEKIEDLNKSIYYSYKEFPDTFDHVAYIQNTTDSGGIEIIISTKCSGEFEKACIGNKVNRNREIVNWFKSIRFINRDEGKD